jgi:dihydrofolate reductase
MGRLIVIEFTTLDGIIQDPDGSERTPKGGWAFRYGPAAVAGDKFRLGEVMDSGALLLGRSTFELFSHIWPGRKDEFSAKMNAMRKYVVSRSLHDVEQQWNNSVLIDGDLLHTVRHLKTDRDVVVAGSISVAHALMQADLVDEYRLLVFPIVLGEGARLFETGNCAELELVAVDLAGAAALLTIAAKRMGQPGAAARTTRKEDNG